MTGEIGHSFSLDSAGESRGEWGGVLDASDIRYIWYLAQLCNLEYRARLGKNDGCHRANSIFGLDFYGVAADVDSPILIHS